MRAPKRHMSGLQYYDLLTNDANGPVISRVT